MRVFGALYEKALGWARDPRATYYLCGLSFAEAFIFPVMPEVMLAPMMLGERRRAFFYANISLMFSLAGAVVGYALGLYAYEGIHLLLPSGMQQTITTWVAQLQLDMSQHYIGMLGALLLAAVQPVIPMKFVTWAAGIVGVPLLPFLFCVALGRGKRVWLLAVLVRAFGERAQRLLQKNIEWLGWAAAVIVSVLLAWWLWLR